MDRGGLEELVRAHQAEIHRYARFLGADMVTAEDVVQETFLAVVKRPDLPPAAEAGARAAWLRGIARNVFLSHCRRDRTNPVRTDSAAIEEAEATWSSVFLRGGDGFDYVEALGQCLETVPANGRRLLDMHYREGRSRADMGALCGMTEDGVKSALRRLRSALADCIGKRLGLAEQEE
jgi:RNA polymerase sigma-70 factor (ECF subfamily)